MADNDSKVRITTSSFALFNDDGIMLKLAYLDDSLSVVIGASEMNNGKRTYPKEKRESFIITSDRAAAMYDIIMDKVIPAVANNENYDGGVLLSKRKDALFQIRVQNGEIIGVYYKDIDDSRKPRATYAYKFTKVPIIESYNPETANFAPREIHSQFALFARFIEGFLLMGTNAGTHSYRTADKYTRDIIMNTLKELAVKLGVSVETYHGFGGQHQNTGFDNDLPFGNDNHMPSIDEVNSLEGIL